MGQRREGLSGPSVCAVIALLIAGLHPVDNPDSFGHLAAGRQIVELGYVPSLDTFSYYRPEPQPWVNYEWLSDWALFEVFRAAGFAGLNLWKLLMIAAAGAILVRVAYARAGRLGAELCALMMIAAVPALRFRLSARPHVFGLLWSAVYWIGLLAILDAADDPTRRVQTRRWVIGLGVAHLAWVNLHGSHLLGLALTGIACAVSLPRPGARKPLATLFGLELAASCISPYGPKIVVGAIEHVFDPRYRAIVTEWQPWTPQQPMWFLIGVLLHAVLVLAAWPWLRGSASAWFMRLSALMLLVMALRSMRFIPDFLLLTAPLAAEGLVRGRERWLRSREGLGPRVHAIVWRVGVVAVGAAAFFVSIGTPPYAAFGLGADLRTLPVASAAWLAREQPRARVFAAMEDGWFVMWGAPNAHVLLDGRVPFYGPEYIGATMTGWANPSALRQLIARSGTNAVIVQPLVTEHQAALDTMLHAPEFALTVIENKHVLFAKRGSTRTGAEGAEFQALQPGYTAPWLLAPNADLAAIRSELAKLRGEPNVRAYVAWVDALLALRPLARSAGEAGFKAPETPTERAAVRGALAKLRPLREVLDEVPILTAYHALTAVLACELDEADGVLDAIREEDRSRETVLAAQELAVRRGERDEVRAFLAQARAMPEAKGDVWLAALEAALDGPPLCGKQ